MPYTGTSTSMTSDKVMILEEESRGVYVTPARLYYSPNNEGKFCRDQGSSWILW